MNRIRANFNDIDQAIYQTWQAIGQDIEDAYGKEATVDLIVEAILDCGVERIEAYGNPTDDAILELMYMTPAQREERVRKVFKN